jgi:hypothetical protein
MNEPDFQRHAQNGFRFLVERYGFTQATSEPSRVRFASNDVAVEVNYSGRGEVDVILDENPPSHRFQLRLFLKAYHPAIEAALGYGIANSDDEVRRELNRLAEALEHYGRPLLEHNHQVFEKMRTFKWWEPPRS